jgi:putative ABC transport system substrate-binding protein
VNASVPVFARRPARRAVLAALGAAAALGPLRAPAQQGLPVVGFLNPRAPGQAAAVVAAFRQGLRDAGHEEGRTVAVAYAWAEDRYERLPELAADLVRRSVAVIVAGSTPSARAARGATAEIPVVFTTGLDPDALVALGLIDSVSRPGANVTGVTFYSSALIAKELELLRELVPGLARVTMLAISSNASAQVQTRDAEAVTRAMGLALRVVPVADEDALESAFASTQASGGGAVLLAVDPLFDSRPERIAALAARHAVPAIYYVREFVEAGGLMSYGGSLTGAYRQAGVYAGRIVAGARVGELPIQQPTTFQLVVNVQAARALGLAIPQSILARADEVIE